MKKFDKLLVETEAATRAKRRYDAAVHDAQEAAIAAEEAARIAKKKCTVSITKAKRAVKTQHYTSWQLRREKRDLEKINAKLVDSYDTAVKGKRALQTKSRRQASKTMHTMMTMPMGTADAERWKRLPTARVRARHRTGAGT
mmetsp:Transcript_48579/g.114716  ORF Transcript_48579/g.114716 Transcript_48579/m.114716 type:complete len:142 (-) Transcript_48579:32-457(-)